MPPPPPPPSLAVAPPSPRRRQRRRVKGRTYNIHVFNYYRYPPPPPVEEERDWTELPLDVTLKIFRCLDPVELLGRVGRVCRFWRRATRDEPELWRRIHMGGCSRDLHLDVFAREAARRSSGRCEAFVGDYFGDDDFLSFLADQAPSLRSLCLSYFYKVTSEGFAEAIARLPFLEKLELSNCHGVDANTGVFELVAKACPRLRLFIHEKHRTRYDPYFSDDPNNDCEALAIARMHGLRSLTLYYDTLTNEGLMAIVDNCPHLEYLDIRSCGNITMNDALKAKCVGIKTKIYVPHRCNDDKDNCSLGSFQSRFRISVYSSLIMSEYFQELQKRREEDAEYYYDPYYYYLSALDEVHLEEHCRLLGKSGWRYNL